MNGSGKPVVYLVSDCGVPSYGDELITAAWLGHLAETMPHAEVWVDTPRPGQATVLHDGIHPDVRFVDTLHHGVNNAPPESASAALDFGREVLRNPRVIAREVSGVEQLAQVDLMHVVGGRTITRTWPRSLALLGAAAEMAERYGTRTALTGANLAGANLAGANLTGAGGAPELASLLAGFDLVDVLDAASRDLIAADVPGVTCTGDDALLSPELADPDPRFPARTLVSVQTDHLSHPLDEVADYIVRTLQEWRCDQSKVVVVELLPPDDAAIAELLSRHLPIVEVLPFSLLWQNGFPAAPRSAWLTTHFHAHLLGAANGGWGVVLPAGGDHALVAPTTLTDLGSDWAVPPDLDTVVPWSREINAPFGGALPGLQAAKRAVADRLTPLLTPRTTRSPTLVEQTPHSSWG